MDSMRNKQERAQRMRDAERERSVAQLLLAMIDDSLDAHRDERVIVRELMSARERVYKRLLALNSRVKGLGGKALPRSRFGRRD
jgi:hypothetical protein